MAMITSLRVPIAIAFLLISSISVVMADDKKETKDPLADKYAEKEKEIGAALKSGLISEEIAERILKEYERQLKADQRRGQLRNGSVAQSDKDGRYLLKIKDGGSASKPKLMEL